MMAWPLSRVPVYPLITAFLENGLVRITTNSYRTTI
jgi:hypothetical protein